MIRDLAGLAATAHDLVVVGGGIYGACIAWDATLRGLRVALVERDDFGGATSANSLRIVHGGLRYLARADLRRMRESIRERSALLRIAPTLVEPLPVLIPTGGHGTRSRLVMAAALRLNDALSLDRNQALDPAHCIPSGRRVSPEECRRLFPGFPSAGTSGGALWYDARVTHPERLTLAFLQAAAGRGAAVANHCEVERVLVRGGAAEGVAARDRLTGATLEIRGRAVVLAAGPWTPELGGGDPARLPSAFALNLELAGRLAETAIGIQTLSGPEEDPVIGGGRHIFLNPQARTTLLGTWYCLPEARSPTELTARGAAALLGEIRAACPALHLDATDVVGYQWGWLPLKAGREPGRLTALAERGRVIDHGAAGGPRGMFSVEGTKLTTARNVAEQAIDRVVASLGHQADPCRTAHERLDEVADPVITLEARVRRAIRDEMAATLPDVFRRLTPGGRPDAPADLAAVAQAAALELGWTEQRKDSEIEAVKRNIGPPGAAPERVA